MGALFGIGLILLAALASMLVLTDIGRSPTVMNLAFLIVELVTVVGCFYLGGLKK